MIMYRSASIDNGSIRLHNQLEFGDDSQLREIPDVPEVSATSSNLVTVVL